MISISHSPNSSLKQQALCLSLLLPWRWSRWRSEQALKRLKEAFARAIGVKKEQVFSFSEGREALYAVLRAAGIESGDEVILQAYTCIVVPNSVVFTSAKPVYVDIDQSLNIDPQKIRDAITERTKAVIVQHTFGIPADLEPIQQICREHNLILIEDCAHSLGASYHELPVGTFGDFAIFSFGRDKVISSVAGGMAVVNNPTYVSAMKGLLIERYSRASWWIAQNLFHPLLVPLCTKLMGKWAIGQTMLLFFQKIGLLNKVYTTQEYQSKEPEHLMYEMPGAMAELAYQQLDKLNQLNRRRQEHAKAYQEFCQHNLIQHQQAQGNSTPAYLRYTILVDGHRDTLMNRAKTQGFLLGNWYDSVIVPKPSSMARLLYTQGSCPRAEKAATESLNLPTHRKLTNTDRNRLLQVLTESYEQQ